MMLLNRYLAMLVVVVLAGRSAVHAQTPPAELPTTPDVTEVLAIEPADSLLGRYRIVFRTAAPLPLPSDNAPTMSFELGDQPVFLTDNRDSSMLHIGYLRQRPHGRLALRPTTAGGGLEAGRDPQALIVDADALLAVARPRHGAFEAAHVVRSEGVIDLIDAWSRSQAVVVARLVRFEPRIDRNDVWEASYEVTDVLRGPQKSEYPRQLVLEATAAARISEVGVKFVVFLQQERAGAALTNRLVAAVRLWWPDRDYVLTFLTGWFAPLGEKGRMSMQQRRAYLFRSLFSPAPEVRRTAAVQLRRDSGGGTRAFTKDERELIRRATQQEPSAVVKADLDQLAKQF